jgi:2-keto-3-deoxy-L-rhamnonate aldolase RhmA
MSLKLMMVASDPAVARAAIEHGVDRIFLDLETRGKAARQQGRGMFLSQADLEDVAGVRAVTPPGRLLVRINAFWAGTIDEVERVLEAGADLLMVPMFTHVAHIEGVCAAAAGRAGVVPLFETAEAVEIAPEVMRLDGVREGYVGLNDLALSFGAPFLFQAMLDPRFDRLCRGLGASGKPFGIGGIGRMGSGRVPAHLLLGEYVGRGASRVILSRAFWNDADASHTIDARAEIEAVRLEAARMQGRTEHEREQCWQALQAAITDASS